MARFNVKMCISLEGEMVIDNVYDEDVAADVAVARINSQVPNAFEAWGVTWEISDLDVWQTEELDYFDD